MSGIFKEIEISDAAMKKAEVLTEISFILVIGYVML